MKKMYIIGSNLRTTPHNFIILTRKNGFKESGHNCVFILYIFSTYFQLNCGSFSTSKEFAVASLHWITTSMVQTFLYVQDYKRTCDKINIYKLYKVKARESSLLCYCLRQRVGLEGRVVSGSDLIPLQYVLRI